MDILQYGPFGTVEDKEEVKMGWSGLKGCRLSDEIDYQNHSVKLVKIA